MKAMGEWPVLSGGMWTGEWKHSVVDIPDNSVRGLRSPGRYWIRDIARDLKPRTLAQVYRENRAGREVIFAFKPKQGDRGLDRLALHGIHPSLNVGQGRAGGVQQQNEGGYTSSQHLGLLCWGSLDGD